MYFQGHQNEYFVSISTLHFSHRNYKKNSFNILANSKNYAWYLLMNTNLQNLK